MCTDLQKLGEVQVLKHQAIVCLVGNGIQLHPGIAARTFAAVRDVNIRMISQGSSEINLSFVVEEDDLKHAVQHLHDEFFPKHESGNSKALHA